MTRRRRWLLNVALTLAAVIGATALFELGLRLAGVSFPLLQTYDDHRGFALRPGAAGWWRREGEAFVRINSAGLRDREHARRKPKDTIRIAVLGDSYAEARSVAREDTFWAELERQMQACAALGKPVEVINFGVTDYGTAQQLLTLRHEVWQYDPDLVLLAFFAGNDIRNNHRELEPKKYRPFFVHEDGRLVLDESFRQTGAYRMLRSWQGQLALSLSDYLRTVQVMREAVVRGYLTLGKEQPARANGPNLEAEAGLDHSQIYAPPVDPVWEEAWRVTEELIGAMADEVKEKSAAFLVVTLTTSAQVIPDSAARQEVARTLGVPDLSYPDRRILDLGKREGFRVLNLAPPMQAHAERSGDFLHGFENTEPGTGHWNEAGHRLAGRLIAEDLCQSWPDLADPSGHHLAASDDGSPRTPGCRRVSDR